MGKYDTMAKWKDYICPICSRKWSICMQREYVYRIKKTFYCSYSCWRKAQKKEKDSNITINFT